MPRGSKEAYTEKQKRQAGDIAEGYRKQGVSEEEAKRRAWATVNAMTGAVKRVAPESVSRLTKRLQRKAVERAARQRQRDPSQNARLWRGKRHERTHGAGRSHTFPFGFTDSQV